MRTLLLLIALASSAGSWPAESLWAQPRSGPEASRRIAYLEPDEADEDFRFQGEFLGRLSADPSHPTGGVQVIAGGNGNFVAVQFEGGLPGAGWNRRDFQRFSGSRKGAAVELAGDDGSSLVVRPERVEVCNAAGAYRGALPRIHRTSPTMGAAPPPGALALFDGQPRLLDNAQLDHGRLTSGFATAFNVGDFQLHVEFRTPYMPLARGQERGNSGIYIQRRYEVQVLDSFGLSGEPNECGGMYRQRRPKVNMCFPPLSWQTYDIYFRAPRWELDGVTKNENARITVVHNGEPVHWDYELPAKTGAGQPETATLLPILFQDHRDPVRYRNLWIAFPSVTPQPAQPFLPPLDRPIFALPTAGMLGNIARPARPAARRQPPAYLRHIAVRSATN